MAPSSPAPAYRRSNSDSFDSSSDSSNATALASRRSPYTLHGRQVNIPPINTSTDSLPRPPLIRAVNDSSRTVSPVVGSPVTFGSHFTHRRQRSQGYFEPTLSSGTPSTSAMTNLTASQIAAQAAMHPQTAHHNRKRSETIPGPADRNAPNKGHMSPPPPVPVVDFSNRSNNPSSQYQHGLAGGSRMAATSAANAAYPRSPIPSPGLSATHEPTPPPIPQEREMKKEKSKMKLFSKPKNIGISRDKDVDRKHPPLPSPGKANAAMNRMLMNNSTTSLTDPSMSSATSIYSSANASTSTLVPLDKVQSYAPEKEKEKHKHHFLSRQKNKLKEKDEYHDLPLSSVKSNSKPTDPAMPQPLYSFAPNPASPSHTSSFATGLDLRHGGRALRQKKKEEKAAALAPYGVDPADPMLRERGQSFQTDRIEWVGPSSLGNSTSAGPSPGPSTLTYAGDLAALGTVFGIAGLTPDDAWPLLKARLLHIFEGEDPRPPIEDFNGLVSVHIRRCIQKRNPVALIEDLRELLQTGFLSLDQTLRHVPDDRLVTNLVEMWVIVFTTILPFLQAVFLPLDLEFKGRGPLMTSREASDFWAAVPSNANSSSIDPHTPTIGEKLDVRRIVLLTFRDSVLLPRNDTLMSIFSRLSLENLSAGIASHPPTPNLSAEPPRPGTSASTDPTFSSFNSQSTTLLDTTSNASSLGLRSRATSNTSAGSFASIGRQSPRPRAREPAPAQMDSSQVTETVGRMLQCVSVLASVQSGDEAQSKMERLTKELKYNWLGRGRTGRQRRGFVGPRGNRGVVVGGAG
ncbi:HbrB-like protein [Pseudovirgaria hyperparasitica]|uniref:HbrB-like protein n=1 Tax=Pseudovirgaria hyperparasitica TaxID=470096 RepID=A0A6A6VQC5_9PEZI|nr:HbrB-like protein [Pseudovirgaria hyperparasitica]KAF2752848.1 HbrB-like protein [Pseudovirgaria hyperparasitica]